jgi:hypothetical protein
MLAIWILALLMLAATPAVAGKPSWAGKPDKDQGYEQGKNQYNRQSGAPAQDFKKGPDSKGDLQGRPSDRQPQRDAQQYRGFFSGRDRSPVDRYYGERFRKGKCPPGLLKKGNGCMPPGQAKKWALHRPLPRDVIFYDLPREVVVSLGAPPAGHRFVRVARDILLISVGTGMVVDAIEDLGREFD